MDQPTRLFVSAIIAALHCRAWRPIRPAAPTRLSARHVSADKVRQVMVVQAEGSEDSARAEGQRAALYYQLSSSV